VKHGIQQTTAPVSAVIIKLTIRWFTGMTCTAVAAKAITPVMLLPEMEYSRALSDAENQTAEETVCAY
jgi:hypothetical protein